MLSVARTNIFKEQRTSLSVEGDRGAGGVREGGEEGAGSGRKGGKLRNIAQYFGIEKMQRGGSQQIEGGNRD